MALQPIGFDGPAPLKVSVAAPDALSKLDTTGLTILQQTQESTQQMYRLHSSNLQEQAQAGERLARSTEANANQIAQAASYASRASADSARNTAQGLQQLSVTVGNIAEQRERSKARDAEAEAQRKREELQALLKTQQERRDRNAAELIPVLEKARSDFLAEDGFRKQGPDAYRDIMSGLIGDADIDADKAQQFGTAYLPEAYRQQQDIIGEEIKGAADLKKEQLHIQKQGILLNLHGALGALAAMANSTPEEIQTQAGVVQEKIKAVYELQGYSETEKAALVGAALEALQKQYGDTVIARAKLTETAENIRIYVTESDTLRQSVLRGDISEGQANDTLRQRAGQLGITFTQVDANRDSRSAAAVLGYETQFKKARQQGVDDAREALPSSTDTISALAVAASLSPATLATLEADKSLDASGKEGLRYAKEFIKFKDGTTTAYRARVATASAAIQSKQDSYMRWLAKARAPEGTDEAHPVMEILRQRGYSMGSTPSPTNRVKFTPEMLAAAQQEYENDVKSEQSKLSVYTDAYNTQVQKFESMGLFLDPRKSQAWLKEKEAVLKERATKLKEIETMRPLTSQAYPPGNNPNFNGGASAPAKPLARRQYMGQSITLPFRVEDVSKVDYDPGFTSGMHYRAARPDRADGSKRTHDGVDFAVPAGTHAVSLVYGVVTRSEPHTGGKGYGENVEILGDDGQTYFYAHGISRSVKKGERVAPGQTVLRTGDTGSPGSFHLHFEVGAKGATIDPIGHLASKQFGQPPKAPRTAGGAIADPNGKQPPGIHIGNGQYLYNGVVTSYKKPSGLDGAVMRAVSNKPATLSDSLPNHSSRIMGPRSSAAFSALVGGVQKPGIPIRPAGQRDEPYTVVNRKAVNYTPASPLQPSFVSRNPKSFAYNETDSHGYAKLKQNPALAAELNRQAKRVGIPGVWLADLIAYESANTFAPSVDNGMGYVGLIQFGRAAAQDLGVTQEQVRNMNPVQQMKLVGDYLKMRLRRARVSAYKTPEHLIAGVNQGNKALYEIDRDGAKALHNPRNADSAGTTLLYYLQNLGKFSGRQYDYPGRVRSAVHTTPTKGCTTCSAMGGTIVPHRS